MSIDDVLARLTVGLDRDEAIARAAAERSAEWHSGGNGVSGGPFESADPEWGITESGKHAIVYDEGWPLAPEAIHIARQDPKATLDRVEAIRKVIAEHKPDQNDDGSVPYCLTCSELNPHNPYPIYQDFPCPTIRALASADGVIDRGAHPNRRATFRAIEAIAKEHLGITGDAVVTFFALEPNDLAGVDTTEEKE